MQKNYNLRLIKTREAYSTAKICVLLNVHERTVQEWYRKGLKTLNEQKPFLVMGYELKRFLEEMLKSRKTKLNPDEFYCTKCREAVKPTDKDVWITVSTNSIGNQGFKSMTIKGICENCNSKLNKFSHTGKLEEVKQIFNVIEGE